MHKRYNIYCIAFIIFSFPSFSQEIKKKKFGQLSRPEKIWIVAHPFVAQKAYRLTQKAIIASHEMKKDSLLDGDDNGGQVDAFRHAYWMALLAQKIKAKKAIRLGMVHEKGNQIQFKKSKLEEGTLPDSISCVMDLANNKIGVQIGKENRLLNENELMSLIKKEVIKGKMKIMLKDSDGNYLDAKNSVIDLNDYLRKWNIPKILTNSSKK